MLQLIENYCFLKIIFLTMYGPIPALPSVASAAAAAGRGREKLIDNRCRLRRFQRRRRPFLPLLAQHDADSAAAEQLPQKKL